jgi:hypothetical protein
LETLRLDFWQWQSLLALNGPVQLKQLKKGVNHISLTAEIHQSIFLAEPVCCF